MENIKVLYETRIFKNSKQVLLCKTVKWNFDVLLSHVWSGGQWDDHWRERKLVGLRTRGLANSNLLHIYLCWTTYIILYTYVYKTNVLRLVGEYMLTLISYHFIFHASLPCSLLFFHSHDSLNLRLNHIHPVTTKGGVIYNGCSA